MDPKKSHSKSKTLEDDIGVKLPKLTPQKRSILNFEEDQMLGYKDQSPFSEKKVVKIPIDRLVPLSI